MEKPKKHPIQLSFPPLFDLFTKKTLFVSKKNEPFNLFLPTKPLTIQVCLGYYLSVLLLKVSIIQQPKLAVALNHIHWKITHESLSIFFLFFWALRLD
uniref:Uncharacterized protein n=1 Tax=Rhizophora mucronata TaxID=61149 RepID=A0A2P2P469_RHIMU